MHGFTAHQLQFACRVETDILLNEHQGSAIRGALFHALRRQFCYQKQAEDCGQCPLWATCPVCFLVATRNPQSGRGTDVPRPYTIEPPLSGQRPGEAAGGPRGSRGVRYRAGESFSFGLTMFAQALNLFPYVVLGSHALEEGGLGKRQRGEDGRWKRGTLAISEIAAVNGLNGQSSVVLRQGASMVTVPDLPLTHEQILARAGHLPRQRLTVCFLTPTRIIEQGGLLRRPVFRPLMQRLHGRLRALTSEYTSTPCDFDFRELLDQAEAVRVVEDHTRWVDLDSYSTRQKRSTPRGGFVGSATFAGELEPFLPWLVWGEVVHVGKDAVKGNGLYRLAGGGPQ